jgi:hypothetical protein
MVEKTIQLARISEIMLDADSPEERREFLLSMQNALIASGYLQGVTIEPAQYFAAFFNDMNLFFKQLSEVK